MELPRFGEVSSRLVNGAQWLGQHAVGALAHTPDAVLYGGMLKEQFKEESIDAEVSRGLAAIETASGKT
jgi:hypothetical protein